MEKLDPKSIQNNKTPSNTFCVLPWLHMATRTWGAITPCCVAEPLEDNLNTVTFSEAWNAKSIKKLRQTMLKGDKSPLCQRCYNEEDVGMDSYRIRSNRQWKDYYSFSKLTNQTDASGSFTGKPIYLDLRLGNKCNLECTMCGPQETTRWEPLSQKIYSHAKTDRLIKYLEQTKKTMENSPSKSWYERPEVKKDIYQQIPFIKRMTIAGGEPLLIKEHHDLLDECIRQKEAHHISLHYHTNGTVTSTQLFEKWKHFESVVVFISLDDLDNRNKYIRYPCSWKMIERNLEIIDKHSPPNVRPMILCTIQVKNIFYFDKFIDYLMNNKFKKINSFYKGLPHTEVVHYPDFLSCQILPKQIKKIITNKFEGICNKYPSKTNRFKTVVEFMNAKDQSHLLPVFQDYTQALDKARGTDFAKTFSELHELMEENR